jgi:hypothetical protein
MTEKCFKDWATLYENPFFRTVERLYNSDNATELLGIISAGKQNQS